MIDDFITNVVIDHAIDLLLVQIARPNASGCGMDEGEAVDHFVADDLLDRATIWI